MFSRPLCRPPALHAAGGALLARCSQWPQSSLIHTVARSVRCASTLKAWNARHTVPICTSPLLSTQTSLASSFQAARFQSTPLPPIIPTRQYSSLTRSVQRLSTPESVASTSKVTRVVTLVTPRRGQHQQARARGGDNTAIFQLIIVGLRFIARTLPFLWRNERIQAFYRRYPKSVLFLIVIPAGAIALFLATHASFVPYSNRLHFTFLGPASEQSLSLQAYQEVITSERERLLPPNDPTVQQVKRVAEDILRVAVQDGVIDGQNMGDWQVNVIESNVANAFVLPSGQIFVYTGILPIVRSEAGLATVLGHEVSHALAHHSVEKMGMVSLLMIAYDFTRGMLDSSGTTQGGLASTAVNFLLTTLAQMVLPLAHSRKMESEADFMGLTLMARAGYNPRAGVQVWERMRQQEEAKQQGQQQWMPEFLSSHPSSQHRITNMQKWEVEAEQLYAEAREKAASERRALPDSDRPLLYRPTRSAAAIERMDKERQTAQTSFQASSLAVGEYRDILNLQ